MRKKVKLFMTIASMCLAVAVLCFGVLSATQVSYTIGGSISYEVDDVFVKINTKIYSTPNQKTESEMNTDIITLSSKTFTQIEAITDYTLTQTMVEYTSNGAESSNTHTAKDSSNNGAKIDYKENAYTYYIVINVENLSPSKSVYAYLSEDISLNSNANTTVATNKKQDAIAKGETSKNIVIGFSLKDKKTSIPSDITFTSNLVVDYEGNSPLKGYIFEVLDSSSKTIKLTSYTGSASNLEIPSTVSISADGSFIEGSDYTVTQIAEEAFKGNTSLVSVVVPSSVTRIGAYAFDGCTSLTSATLNEKDETIDYVYWWAITDVSESTAYKSTYLNDAVTNATYLTTTYKDKSFIQKRGPNITK